MHCCTTRGDQEDARDESPFLSLFAGLWTPHFSANRSTQGLNNLNEEPERLHGDDDPERSASVLRRHVAAVPPDVKSHVFVYNIEDQKQAKGRSRSSRQTAQPVPCNSMDSVPIENEHFKGKVLFLYRPLEGP
mmetsp:Transcript_14322/g.25173  ORF Transcript_14322/g.25173 Transcript_14322/m.25173 type:complete len:133 (-) Transcript_14322:26-424(-)